MACRDHLGLKGGWLYWRTSGANLHYAILDRTTAQPQTEPPPPPALTAARTIGSPIGQERLATLGYQSGFRVAAECTMGGEQGWGFEASYLSYRSTGMDHLDLKVVNDLHPIFWGSMGNPIWPPQSGVGDAEALIPARPLLAAPTPDAEGELRDPFARAESQIYLQRFLAHWRSPLFCRGALKARVEAGVQGALLRFSMTSTLAGTSEDLGNTLFIQAPLNEALFEDRSEGFGLGPRLAFHGWLGKRSLLAFASFGIGGLIGESKGNHPYTLSEAAGSPLLLRNEELSRGARWFATPVFEGAIGATWIGEEQCGGRLEVTLAYEILAFSHFVDRLFLAGYSRVIRQYDPVGFDGVTLTLQLRM